MHVYSISNTKKSSIEYITDTEGDLAYFEKQVQQSKIIQFGTNGIEFKDNNGFFVFGGDVFDRGSANRIGGDIRLSKLLADFKKTHPDRVFLIIGNRDVNKTRFSTELPLNPTHQFHTIDIPKPVFAGPNDTFRNYLIALVKTSKQDVQEDDLIVINTPINRLKWILLKTMGAPGAFEYRRNELAVIAQCDVSEVTEHDVYLSFRLSVETADVAKKFIKENDVSSVVRSVFQYCGSFVRDYLELGQLAAVINDALFVHGGITSSNKGKVPVGFTGFEPNTEVQFTEYTHVKDWVCNLNSWYSDAFQRWSNAGHHEQWSDYQFSDAVPGAPLQYIGSGPGKYSGKTVVVANFFANSSPKMPGPLSEDVINYLHDSGIYYVLSGHQPHGNTPVYIAPHHSQKAVTVITADTLYGHKDAYNGAQGDEIRTSDPRGAAYATVTLFHDSDSLSSYAVIAGHDGYGKPYDFITPFCTKGVIAEVVEGNFIGTVVTIDNIAHLVRVNSGGDDFVLSTVTGPFAVTYTSCTRHMLTKLTEQVSVTASSVAGTLFAITPDIRKVDEGTNNDISRGLAADLRS